MEFSGLWGVSEHNAVFLIFVNQEVVFVLYLRSCSVCTVGTDESQESSMTDADDTQLHAAESDEF